METILPYIPALFILILYSAQSAETGRLKKRLDDQQRRLDRLSRLLEEEEPFDSPIDLSEEQRQRLAELVHEGRKIQAIKILRDETGLGLKEAKDYVDRL